LTLTLGESSSPVPADDARRRIEGELIARQRLESMRLREANERLESAGATLLTAGLRPKPCARSGERDIVPVSDIEMPDEDGYQLLHRMPRNPMREIDAASRSPSPPVREQSTASELSTPASTRISTNRSTPTNWSA
jgi:CheY-like chemotaxis protein